MAAQLEDIERIFQDISNHINVKSLEILDNSNNGLDVNYNLQIHVQKYKSHLRALQSKLVGLQTQSRFLENLAKENWSSTEGLETQEHQAHTKDECKKDKQNIEELETEIDKLAETLCTKHKLLKEKLELLEQKISATNKKKEEYEALKERSEEMAGKLKGMEGTKDSLGEYKEKQLEADLAIKECKASVSCLEHCRGLLHLEVSRLQESVSGLQDDLRRQETVKNSSDEQEQQHSQWLAGAVELYSNLGGIKVQSVHGDSIALEIPNDAQPEDQASGADQQTSTPLILTIKFRLDGGTRPVFAGAEVSLNSLFIDDLVEEATRSEDVVGFVLQVKSRVRNQRTLIKEVEELQRNYAMDWEPSHGRVRVMLGRSGKIVCTLKVDPLYSEARGHVSLLGVEGNVDKRGIESLQTFSSRNLTEWITELQQLFSTQ